MRARTAAREATLKALYMLDMRPDMTPDELDETLRREAPQDSLAFARELLKGTREHMPEIDLEVESIALNWNLRRMAAVDRNVIRLGSFELMHRPDIPGAVVINEAVVMAKKYSTKDSGGFVNGILDKVMQRHPNPARASRDLAAVDDPLVEPPESESEPEAAPGRGSS
jgi:transcription antitermination factor NusB